MPTYTVRSADFTGTVETPFEADARIIATIAFLDIGGATGPGVVTGLSVVTTVTGGRFAGDNETYLSTEGVLRGMGRFDGESAVFREV